MWAPNKVKQEPFLSHSIWEKLFSPLFWHLCSREEENRRDAGNTTIQAEPCDGRSYTTSTTHHCAQHPATEVIHSAQSAAQTTCEHKHCVYNKRAQRRQWKCNAKKLNKIQGCRTRAEITAFERNISDLWKLSLSPHPLMSKVRKRWTCFKLKYFGKWRTQPAIQRLVPGSKEGGWPPGSWRHLVKSLHIPAPDSRNLELPFGI